MKTSPDMRRRSIFVEIHLEAEKAEDRIFKQRLDDATLLKMRPCLLAALWALVKTWDMQGRPEPSRSHSEVDPIVRPEPVKIKLWRRGVENE